MSTTEPARSAPSARARRSSHLRPILTVELLLRLLVGAVGIGLGLFGLLRLLQTGWPNVIQAAIFAAGGVILHDGVLAPVTVVLTVLARPLVPRAWKTPVTLGMVVLTTVTVTAVPVLTGLGRRSDNATLLDRDYLVGWLVLAALVAVATVVGGLVGQRRERRRALHGADPDTGPAPLPEGTEREPRTDPED